jgi:hypothetical protein
MTAGTRGFLCIDPDKGSHPVDGNLNLASFLFPRIKTRFVAKVPFSTIEKPKKILICHGDFEHLFSPFLLMTVLSHFETICKRILSRKATLQNEQGALLAPLSLYPLPIPVSPLGSHGRGLHVRLRGMNGAEGFS